MSTNEPVKKLKVPKELKKYGNGKLPPHELHPITGGGTMWGKAAFWWNHMAAEAAQAGIIITGVSNGYRSYEQQERLFLVRYLSKPTGRIPEVTRRWKLRRWYLRKGKSPSATPGTSPHGWGLAQDIEVPRATYNWMCANAPRYGFYLQGPSKLKNGKPNPEFEAWHWQFCHI
jgi:LAS superfamily LD-carboxypeptidase LdcB